MKVSTSHRNDALPGKRVPADQNRCGMQITRGADYAVRVMIHLLQCPENALNTLPLLANATGVPQSFLSKVLQGLSRAGYVASRRGHVGGFAILPAGRKASLADIVESIDGPFRLNACISTGIRCDRVAFCVAHPVWVEAQEAMLAVLRSRTITELASRTSLPQTVLVSLQPRVTLHDSDRRSRDG